MIGVHPSIIVIPWFKTLLSQQLSITVLFRLWDILFLKGEIVIFRVALSIFKNMELRNKDAETVLESMMCLDTLVGAKINEVTADSILTKDEFDTLFRNLKE